MQREFARLYVLNGGIGRHAALEAGYSPLTADRAAQKCLTSRLVGAEIQRLSIVNLSAKLPQLISQLLEIAENPKTESRVRVHAITALMDRAGVTRQSGQANVAVQVNVNNSTSASTLIAEIWNDKSARESASRAIPLAIIDPLADVEPPKVAFVESSERLARSVRS